MLFSYVKFRKSHCFIVFCEKICYNKKNVEILYMSGKDDGNK